MLLWPSCSVPRSCRAAHSPQPTHVLCSTNLGFRVATKWDVARGQIRNKRRVAMGPGAEARVHWALSYHLPEIEG